eukprot:CAMPEP_0113584284 /NCGR_PEP_ID=MMETSP0015_2-20120614/33016_1 /TAXON_ID=2838 /ORGANISM="Odontella" /LENGTH=115 /DNA_ID=CAMNT_0000489313 /DNA_START=55 /DNA_END=399 /DNA_ORIENTATION=- /assembly_acc=CAM_ASM_000160
MSQQHWQFPLQVPQLPHPGAGINGGINSASAAAGLQASGLAASAQHQARGAPPPTPSVEGMCLGGAAGLGGAGTIGGCGMGGTGIGSVGLGASLGGLGALTGGVGGLSAGLAAAV